MKTVIEINGRQYDARTGKLISDSTPSVSTTPVSKPVQKNPVVQPQPRAGIALDGFNRRRVAPQRLVPTVVAPLPLKRTSRVHPAAAKALDIKPTHHKPQRAKTLLRGVVRKPQKVAPQIHSTSSNVHSKVERSATGRGLLLKRTPDSRLNRAKLTAKSLSVRKFSTFGGSKKPRLSETLTVEVAPNASGAAPLVAPVITKPVLGSAHQKEQVFNHSIAQASHHNSPKVRKDKFAKRFIKRFNFNPRVLAVSATVFTVLLLGGFLAYQNIPSVAMRVAANKAGFSGHIPSNTPAGFSYKGPVEYSKGNIAVTFSSNSDERSFVITQKPTEWTSESLLSNYIVASKTRYQTYHDKGLTVFIYNDGNATWVDKGVWYSIKGEGALSSDQILAIAASM